MTKIPSPTTAHNNPLRNTTNPNQSNGSSCDFQSAEAVRIRICAETENKTVITNRYILTLKPLLITIEQTFQQADVNNTM